MGAPPHLAFLLHMHQPLYVDPQSGCAEMPWVRLHAARAYLDVAHLLDQYPQVALTVNFVPSLLEQLERLVAGELRDAWLELALQPTWNLAERQQLLTSFFSVHWGRHVETRPRYRELLDKRGRAARSEEVQARARDFTDGELRDLTVLFHLAWLGFAARSDDSHRKTVEALERKARGYTVDDLHAVIAVGQAACARVLPLYRKLAERGQIELSSSPAFHPIIPLLIDSDAARRSRPEAQLPERFAWPEDARAQIAAGREAHARVFGAPPRGMWPPEGSVSPEALAAYRAEGIAWLATDEGNLWRSLDGIHARGELYRPWRVSVEGGGVDMVFRDRDLSDRIGFSYAFGEAQSAVDDLLGRVRQAGSIAEPVDGGPPLVSIILDGENPWEAYPGSGEPFLRALFTALSRDEGVRSTSVGGYLAAHPGRAPLSRIHSGSWIDSDFHIWIGDPVKNRAWDLLGRARKRFARAVGGAAAGDGSAVGAEQIAQARHHLLAAEGSDWFWWFGEPFHSAEEEIFDRLFRAHLAAAWTALGEPVPAALTEPVTLRGPSRLAREPRGLISPVVDGRVASYFDWVDAGRYEVPRGAAMAEGPLITMVHYGCDEQRLFLRLDPAPEARSRLGDASLEVLVREGRREVALHASLRATTFRIAERTLVEVGEGAAPRATDAGEGGQLAFADVVELSAPFARLGLAPGARLELYTRLREGDVMLGRFPRDGYLGLVVPDESYAADHWSV